jgi:hypothetical protein
VEGKRGLAAASAPAVVVEEYLLDEAILGGFVLLQALNGPVDGLLQSIRGRPGARAVNELLHLCEDLLMLLAEALGHLGQLRRDGELLREVAIALFECEVPGEQRVEASEVLSPVLPVLRVCQYLGELANLGVL